MPLVLTEGTGINLTPSGGNLVALGDATGLLTLIKTVDGASSGLDADLLDGLQASAFATAAQGVLAGTATQPGDTTYATNANGHYLRLPSGIQVCWHKASPSIAVSTSSTKGGFVSAVQTWTYPIAFSATPLVFCSIEATAGTSGNIESSGTTTGTWRIRAITTQTATATPIYLLAIGTWA